MRPYNPNLPAYAQTPDFPGCGMPDPDEDDFVEGDGFDEDGHDLAVERRIDEAMERKAANEGRG